jgi:hypothetical protein
MGMEHDALRQDAGEPGRDLEMLMHNDEICRSLLSDPRRMVRNQRGMVREYGRNVCCFEFREEIVHVLGHDARRITMAARGDEIMNA